MPYNTRQVNGRHDSSRVYTMNLKMPSLDFHKNIDEDSGYWFSEIPSVIYQLL